MSDLVYRAMMFARRAHAGQVRKYTGNPYHDHLAEVAGIVAASRWSDGPVHQAVAWLHDTIEDTPISHQDIWNEFSLTIANAVLALSDLETGNRAERKAAARIRLAQAPGWVQTIKCADLISNTSSIVMHDPKFAKVYLAEKRALLEVMTKADPRLRQLALELSS